MRKKMFVFLFTRHEISRNYFIGELSRKVLQRHFAEQNNIASNFVFREICKMNFVTN